MVAAGLTVCWREVQAAERGRVSGQHKGGLVGTCLDGKTDLEVELYWVGVS